eukprot:scaffold34599_cov279-Amphora_coffeaeformis.AAC.3
MAVLGISRTDYYEGDGTTMEETTSSYYNYGQHKLPYYTPRCFIHGALLPPWIRRSPGWLQCLLLGCLFIFLAAALIIFASVAWQIREGEESASSAQQQQRDQAWRNNNIVLATPAPSSLLQLPAEVTVVPTVVPSAFPSFEPSRGPSGIPSRVPSGTPSEAPSLVPSEQPTASFTDVPSVSLEPSQSFEPTHRPSVSMAPSLSWEPTGSFTQLAASSNMPTSVFGQQTTTTSIPTMLPSLAPSSPPTAMPTSIPSSAPSESQRVMMGGGGMGMRDSESSSLRPRRTAFPTFAPRGVNTRGNEPHATDRTRNNQLLKCFPKKRTNAQVWRHETAWNAPSTGSFRATLNSEPITIFAPVLLLGPCSRNGGVSCERKDCREARAEYAVCLALVASPLDPRPHPVHGQISVRAVRARHTGLLYFLFNIVS